MNPKETAIRERIKRLEDRVLIAREFLASGKHADWNGFRPLFVPKLDKVGKQLPPHRDWVENVFLPRQERSLQLAAKKLERLTAKDRDRNERR